MNQDGAFSDKSWQHAPTAALPHRRVYFLLLVLHIQDSKKLVVRKRTKLSVANTANTARDVNELLSSNEAYATDDIIDLHLPLHSLVSDCSSCVRIRLFSYILNSQASSSTVRLHLLTFTLNLDTQSQL